MKKTSIRHFITSDEINKLKQSRKRNRTYVFVCSFLAVIVAAGTVTGMIQPAASKTRTESVLDCSYAVHEHTEECYEILYDEEGHEMGRELICGQSDFVAHRHTEECYRTVFNVETQSEEYVLVCELPEIEAHEHDESCYEEKQVLICEEDHEHDETCYEIQKELICDKPELHEHDASCYDEWGNRICGKVELLEHQHDDSCFTEVEVAADEEEAETAAEEETVSADMPAQDFHDRTDELIIDVSAPEGAFPADTTMKVIPVSDKEVLNAAVSAAEDPATRVTKIQAADISFFDSEGNALEPAVPIRVIMTPTERLPEEKETAAVYHVDDNTVVTTVELNEADSAAEAVVFETDAFSVYALVYTMELQTEGITARGETYEITVSYDSDAGIPADARLEVNEILPEDTAYEEYYQDALKTVNADTGEEKNYARFFDISIMSGEDRIEPSSDVIVTIRLSDAPKDRYASANVVHFTEEGSERMELSPDSGESGEIRVVTDSFSVYSVIYTVDFNFEVDGKEYAFRLEGGDSTSFKEILERFDILEKEDAELFIENIGKVEFTNPEYLWNGKLEEDAFAGDLKKQNDLDIYYASYLKPGNILAMDVHHYSAPDWVLIALKPFTSEETLTVTMKNGDVFTVKVTDAQSDAPHNPDGTVQTVPNPQGTTIELFNYFVSEETKTAAGRDQWPGHIHNDTDFWMFNWYDLDGQFAASWGDGFNHDDEWKATHLLGYGNNLGINQGHMFKFSPANAGTVIDGTLGTKTSDIPPGPGLNSYTQDADPRQGIVEGTLVNGYPQLTVNPSIGTGGESLAYLFDDKAHAGKESKGSVNNLMYVDPEGYYTFDSRDFNAAYQENGTFLVTDHPADASNTEKGFWPFGSQIYWSGMHINTQFSMPENGQVLNPKHEYKDMQFEFSGDDDTWLYVDGVLIGDGGGVHNRTEIDINFATGKVTVTGLKDPNHGGQFSETKYLDDIYKAAGRYNEDDWEDIGDGSGHKRFKAGTYHTFDMFYLERGGGESNLYIHYNLVSTDDFTAHKAYSGYGHEERMERDQFRFEMIGLDGQYQSVWNPDTQTADVALLDRDGRAIMPERGKVDGEGTFEDPKKVYSENAYTDCGGTVHGGTTLTTGVLENGDIRFGAANISEDEKRNCDEGHPSLYRYIIREIVPEDAVNADGVTWADATDEQKAAGGFIKDETMYDGTIYYMTARVISWQQTGADGNEYTAYGLSKTYYTDDTFTEVKDDTSFVDFRNKYVPKSGEVDFLKTDGSNHPLAGAGFTLYEDIDCTIIATDLGDEDKGIPPAVQVKDSDEDGKVVFTNMAAPRTYYMKETKTPDGYEPNNTVYKVVIEDSNDKTKKSKITVLGDESETPVTTIVNTKPGEISVIKNWVSQNGTAISGGNRSATVQLRRYKYETSDLPPAQTHNITIVFKATDYGGVYHEVSKTETFAGESVKVIWYVPNGADQSVFSGWDTVWWDDSTRTTFFSRSFTDVSSDIQLEVQLGNGQYWIVNNGFSIDYFSVETDTPVPVTELVPDTDFPSATDTAATQTLSADNAWAHVWKIGSEADDDFPAGNAEGDYLYYVVELDEEGNDVPIGGEMAEGVTLQSIVYNPAKREDAGITSGSITVTNRVPVTETTQIEIEKYDKKDLNDDTAETLKGASFRLEKYTDPDYQNKDTEWTAADDGTGVFHFTDLQEGWYRIVEVETPEGYIKVSSDPEFTVTMNTSGELEVTFSDTDMVIYDDHTFRYGNEPGAELPYTGGTGTYPYTIPGMIILLTGIVLFLHQKKTTAE